MEAVKAFLNSGAGVELKAYLLGRLEELKDIENLAEKNTTAEQAIEVKAQRRAYLKLKAIYSEIMTLSEEKKVKDDRDRYDSE